MFIGTLKPISGLITCIIDMSYTDKRNEVMPCVIFKLNLHCGYNQTSRTYLKKENMKRDITSNTIETLKPL